MTTGTGEQTSPRHRPGQGWGDVSGGSGNLVLIPKTKSYLVAIKNGEQNVSKWEIIFCSLKKK